MTWKQIASSRIVLIVALSLGAVLTLSSVGSAQETASGSGTDWDGLRQRLEAGADPMAIVDELTGGAGGGGDTEIDDFEMCQPLPGGGLPGLTNDRFYFLSEILQGDVPLDSPGCGDQLACFLKQVSTSPHANATLIIDRQCVSDRTLTIPSRFTLAGVGIGGEGVLVFDLPTPTTALRLPSGPGVANRLSVIRDLSISNASCCGQTGLQLFGSGFVDLERIQISGFAVGLRAEHSYSVNVRQSRFFNNGFNIVLGEDTTTWRFRDTLSSQTFLAGLVIGPTARGHLFSGGRMESNPYAAIVIHGLKNVIENTWFEGNGGASQKAISFSPGAIDNRILSNLFASQVISGSNASNVIVFNM